MTSGNQWAHDAAMNTRTPKAKRLNAEFSLTLPVAVLAELDREAEEEALTRAAHIRRIILARKKPMLRKS